MEGGSRWKKVRSFDEFCQTLRPPHPKTTGRGGATGMAKDAEWGGVQFATGTHLI